MKNFTGWLTEHRTRKALRRAKSEAASLIARADASRDQKRFSEAAQFYELALAARPDDARIHVQCGHMNKEIGRMTLAEAHYRVAQLFLPEDADLHLQLGHFYKVAGRAAEALAAYKRAASLSPGWAEPQTELANLAPVGEAAEQPKNEDQAHSSASYLDMIAHFRRLMVCVLLPQNTAAQVQAIRLPPLPPNEPIADTAPQASETNRLADEADRMRDQGRFAEAADLYEAALLGQHAYPHLHVQCGHMNKEIGRYDFAESHYDSARALLPDDPDIHLQLGHFYKVTGRLADSAASYERAASLVPGWQEAADEAFGMRQRLATLPGPAAPPRAGVSEALLAAVSHPETTAIQAGEVLSSLLARAIATRFSQGNRLEDLFDTAFYRSSYPEVAADGRDPMLDYLTQGWRAGRNPNALFDGTFYLTTYPDAAATGMNPLLHYVFFGQFEGKNPGPLFDTVYYLTVNKDVREEGFNPLIHFLTGGMAEGRDPHPLFNVKYYRMKYANSIKADDNIVDHYLRLGASQGYRPNPLFFSDWYSDRMEGTGNPLVHYLVTGRFDGKAPNPVFDPQFYLNSYPEIRAAQIEPLAHYLATGWRERRDPHPLFNTTYYLANNPSLEAQGVNPLGHYLEQGYREDCAPSALFDPLYYRSICPAARTGTINPLIHYIEHGAVQGFEPTPRHWMTSLLDNREEGREFVEAIPADAVTRINLVSDALEPPGPTAEYTTEPAIIPLCAPLNICAVSSDKSPTRLNVLLPVAGMSSTSGGPNTVLNLAYRLARMGVPIRIISTDAPPDGDPKPYLEHARNLAGAPADEPVDIIVADGSNRSRVLYVGQDDQFLASAWATAQMANVAVRQTSSKRFFYMIQDYEPLLHESSTWSALAEQTYSFDMVPIINTRLLFEFLQTRGIGRFNDPAFCGQAVVFDPAVGRSEFYHVSHEKTRRRRLLFYARPTSGRRNLFEIGVAVLRKLLADGVLLPEEWDFVGMGEPFKAVDLGHGAALVPAPWLGFSEYAEMMRESSILLSLMLSPHPSYPPIEMAACGRLAVTTEFGNKTAAALRAISPNIIAAEPTREALSAALAMAVTRSAAIQEPSTDIAYPASWEESLAPVADQVFTRLLASMGAPTSADSKGNETLAVGFRQWPAYAAALTKYEHQPRRRTRYNNPEASLVSFVTTVWNTDPLFFCPLIESVLRQDCQGFEWIILDNGCTREDTLALIAQLSDNPCVRVYRVDENIGIIRGMRFVLERASGAYIVPLDSDDLLTPDCVRVVTTFLREAGYPEIAYTDEDRLVGDTYLEPYCKPKWDPVLFFHSCYIAHLCCIKRAMAIDLGAYTDSDTNGSHDWDTFTRFYLAGYTPVHIPEIVYSWRLHEQSTAANIDSKTYIASSHRKVLGRLIAAQSDAGQYALVTSPLFNAGVDWRFVRELSRDFKLVTLIVGSEHRPGAHGNDAIHLNDTIHLPLPIDWKQLAEVASRIAESGAVIHLAAANLVIQQDDWRREAHALMGLFPDTAVVGGLIHREGRIVAADTFFGVSDGSRSPNVNRLTADPGYFAQAWKPHSCDAVPAQHCVVRADLLAATAACLVGTCATFGGLGLWIGRVAAKRSERVVYSPFFAATLAPDQQAGPSRDERRAQLLIQSSHGGGREWPPALGKTPRTVFSTISSQALQRERAALRILAEQADASPPAALLARKIMADPITHPRSISVLTSVWEKTDSVVFDVTCRSILEQTMPPDEWVILKNGPVPPAVERMLESMAIDRRISLHSIPINIGIMGAMRFCLEAAKCDLVVPMDADDVLVPDALETLQRAVTGAAADMVFSDEDILQDDRIVARIQRHAFDPILNTDDSYIWHICGFDRTKALALGVYSDSRAEFCHDWDTVSRFASAGCRIEHIPHALYHWRVHQNSSSNSGELNMGSLKSVRFVLQRTIDGQADPALYEVAPFPISRGVEQLAILRRPVIPMSVALVVLSTSAFGQPVVGAFLPGAADQSATFVVQDAFGTGGAARLQQALQTVDADIVCVLAEGCLPEPDGAWEAMRLFELHDDVVLAGGRLYRPDRTVVDACATNPQPDRPNPWIGRPSSDPGHAALALKPQTAFTVPSFYFYGRTTAFRQATAQLDGSMSLIGIGTIIAEILRSSGGRIAYSPLIQGCMIADPRLVVDAFGQTYPALPIPKAAPPLISTYAGANPGTILSPTDWAQVGQLPAIEVAADPANDLHVIIQSLKDFHADPTSNAFGTLKRSTAIGTFIAEPIFRLAPGNYIASVVGRSGEVISRRGIMVSRQSSLQPIVDWRDPAIPDMPATSAASTPLFSITTTAYDTPLIFLRELADCILGQTLQDFEWLLLDNGSAQPEIIRYLRELGARDERLRVFRVDENIHIIPGNRYLLERARGRYIVPVDSDDIVYADALDRIARYAAHYHDPDLLYSEEVKVDVVGRPQQYIWRPGPSAVFALATCPAAHLMAFKRERALALGVYSDDYAKGSHDWDTYLRMIDAGAKPVRVPEVLYGWRMHEASSSMSTSSKDYLAESQLAVVQKSLERRGLAARLKVKLAQEGELGYYHFVRTDTNLPKIGLDIVVRDTAADVPQRIANIIKSVHYQPLTMRIHIPMASAGAKELRKQYRGAVRKYETPTELATYLSRSARATEYTVVVDSVLAPIGGAWLHDVVATFELDPSVGLVGGCILGPAGEIVHAGYVAGLDGFFGTPLPGDDPANIIPGSNQIRKAVTATYAGLMAFRHDLVDRIGPLRGIDGDEGLHGIEFSLRAQRAGFLSALCPSFSAIREAPLLPPAASEAPLRYEIATNYADLIGIDPYYSRFLSHESASYGQIREVQSIM